MLRHPTLSKTHNEIVNQIDCLKTAQVALAHR